MLMGLGTTLFEAIEFADGQVTNANFSDYNVPAFGDLPQAHARADRERRRRGPRAGGDRAAAGPARDRQRARFARRARDRAADHRRARAGGAGAMKVDVFLNGRAATLEARSDEMLLPALRRQRPAVGARDVRDRRLRRLHGAARRRAGVRLPDAHRDRGRARDHRPSRASTRRIPSCARSTRRTPSSAAGARRASCSTVKAMQPGDDDPRGARRQPVPLRLLREDRGGGARDASRDLRRRRRRSRSARWKATRVVDLGFDGDMVAFIAAGAPEGARSDAGEARLLAPAAPALAARLPRLRGPHEERALAPRPRRSRTSGTTSPPTTRGCPTP